MKLVFSGGPDQHRIFVEGGSLYIADRSGRTPLDTDDLPCRLKTPSEVVLTPSAYGGLVSALDVIMCSRRELQPAGGTGTVHTSPLVAAFLASHWSVPLVLSAEGGALGATLTIVRGPTASEE